jgi:hypothetical protein
LLHAAPKIGLTLPPELDDQQLKQIKRLGGRTKSPVGSPSAFYQLSAGAVFLPRSLA